MEMQPQRLLRAAPPTLTLPPPQPVPPTPPPSPTGLATPPTSPDAPRTPPPSPASPRAPRPSPSAAPNPPPSPQAALTLLPPLKAQENRQILPWVPMFGIPLILALPSNQQVKLQQFWEKQKRDVEGMINFNSHELPLARVKRMMKSDDPLSKVAGDVPALFSKACEMFISELTLRGWFNTEKCHRRTLSPSDITEATYYTNTFDFLVNVIPWDRDLALKIALNGSGPTTDNSSYNGKDRINNANGGSCAVVIGAIDGGCGMGISLPSSAMWLRIPGMMMGPNSAGTGIDIGNFSVDMGSSGFVGMRYHYMPVEPTSVFPLLESGETSSSQSSGMRGPVYAPYGALPYQPNQAEDDDEPIN